MKKPRELLLDRHRHAEPSLDAIRTELRRALEDDIAAEARHRTTHRESALVVAWQELFVACRRWWMGLTTAWCAIVLLAMVADGTGGRGTPALTSASLEPVAQAVRDQQRLQAELLGLAAATERRVARREDNRGPRSEIPSLYVNV